MYILCAIVLLSTLFCWFLQSDPYFQWIRYIKFFVSDYCAVCLSLPSEWPPQSMSWCQYVSFLPCPLYQQALYCFWLRRGSASLSIFSLLVGSNPFCTGLQTLFGTWSVSVTSILQRLIQYNRPYCECMSAYHMHHLSRFAAELHSSCYYGGLHLHKFPAAGLCLRKKPSCTSAASLVLWVMTNKTKWLDYIHVLIVYSLYLGIGKNK